MEEIRSSMSAQPSSGDAVPSSRSSQRSFLDDVILTFSSPMAWLLIVALVITWSAVAIVLFDLLDYKTLADKTKGGRTGVPPPSAAPRRTLKIRGGVRPIKSSLAGIDAQESTDWLGMIWTFATSLIAPDEEEEGGIHQLTESLTSFHSEEL
ncbi:triadin isoform X5 [Cololabis saira]|uniref:triadin isoform X5 n=1 Tax=Cololabis saira TaxID=129043 RepID=UPI002AD504E7|nr:triadin isoform X5 [Cololabis saira]